MGKSLVRGFNWSRIREFRLQHGWSQQGLADTIGVDRKQVGRWEVGGHSPGPDSRLLLFSLFPDLLESYKSHLVGTCTGKGVPSSCE